MRILNKTLRMVIDKVLFKYLDRKNLCVKSNRNDKDTQNRNYTKVSKRQNEKQNSNTEKKLHPSWEASLKRKQEQCALTKFEGKRITFDD